MRLIESDALQRFRKKRFRFQQTFITPLDDLARFTDATMSALPLVHMARAVFDQVVFEPKNQLLALYQRYSLPHRWYDDDLTLEAKGQGEAGELLSALLSEWIDFLYIPTPESLVIYADHDEFITFLANSRENLAPVVDQLAAARFKAVDYQREF